MLRRVFTEFDSADVELACWYSLYDQMLLGAPELMVTAFKNMGMHIVDGTPKPALALWKAVYGTPATSVISTEREHSAGEGPELMTPYPNPFNASTRIEFTLPEDGFAKLDVYDILGQHVQTLVDEYKTAGVHCVEFDSGSQSSGVYFYRLTAGDFVEVKKMVLMR